MMTYNLIIKNIAHTDIDFFSPDSNGVSAVDPFIRLAFSIVQEVKLTTATKYKFFNDTFSIISNNENSNFQKVSIFIKYTLKPAQIIITYSFTATIRWLFASSFMSLMERMRETTKNKAVNNN